MKIARNLGNLLLAIWLIATGLLALVEVNIPAVTTVLALLAIAAGVALLLDWRGRTRNLGTLLLGAWLILTGLLPLLNVTITGSDVVLAVLALAAGVLLLLQR